MESGNDQNNFAPEINKPKRMTGLTISAVVLAALAFWISYILYSSSSDAFLFIYAALGLGAICAIAAGTTVASIFWRTIGIKLSLNKLTRFVVSFSIVAAVVAIDYFVPTLIKDNIAIRQNISKIEEFNNSSLFTVKTTQKKLQRFF